MPGRFLSILPRDDVESTKYSSSRKDGQRVVAQVAISERGAEAQDKANVDRLRGRNAVDSSFDITAVIPCRTLLLSPRIRSDCGECDECGVITMRPVLID